ncbi:MAG TPA: FAD-binding oxidoreductase [Solirubrobacteraceae bacterium]|nr:FAD-binding oxidoreductase [Solirubrobacteraceae bacterium]
MIAPFWLENLPAREPQPALAGSVEADLCIVGGGFTGLWAALQAKADDPDRDVVLLEAETIAFGASGRNGGFAQASLTHGLENGLSRFGDEIETLERLGRENMDGLVADLERHRIDCDFEATGDLTPSMAAYQDTSVEHGRRLYERFGYDVEVFPDATAIQAEVDSPLYRAGLWVKDASALVDPAKLAFGLLCAALRAGVRVFEGTTATGLDSEADRSVVRTVAGQVRARRVLLATSAFPPVLRAIRRYVVPVYDYALMSEPLSAAQREQIGWRRRQGISEGANQFHYYRQSRDGRILWGGYDAVYRFGGPVRPDLDADEVTFARLAQNFFTVFPQLEGLRFTHRWGGAIDTCSRFSVFFGTAHRGRVAYAVGYTGLGVVATRFGARVALDLLDGRQTEATRTRYVRSKPVPFPPEPLRSAAIQLTRNRLTASDRRDGRRGIWLATLDRLGLGFDS